MKYAEFVVFKPRVISDAVKIDSKTGRLNLHDVPSVNGKGR